MESHRRRCGQLCSPDQITDTPELAALRSVCISSPFSDNREKAGPPRVTGGQSRGPGSGLMAMLGLGKMRSGEVGPLRAPAVCQALCLQARALAWLRGGGTEPPMLYNADTASSTRGPGAVVHRASSHLIPKLHLREPGRGDTRMRTPSKLGSHHSVPRSLPHGTSLVRCLGRNREVLVNTREEDFKAKYNTVAQACQREEKPTKRSPCCLERFLNTQAGPGLPSSWKRGLGIPQDTAGSKSARGCYSPCEGNRQRSPHRAVL